MQNELVQLGAGAHALAIQILGNRDDAADVVQDALTRTLAAPERYDATKGPLKPWFFRVVRNGCLDLLRGRKHQGETVDGLPDPAPGPDAALDKEQRHAEVRIALDRLPVDARQVLVLRDYLDLSYAEIAVVLDVPKGTVMSRLHRARNALREELTDHVNG